jgi:hypothetical protein
MTVTVAATNKKYVTSISSADSSWLSLQAAQLLLQLLQHKHSMEGTQQQTGEHSGAALSQGIKNSIVWQAAGATRACNGCCQH